MTLEGVVVDRGLELYPHDAVPDLLGRPLLPLWGGGHAAASTRGDGDRGAVRALTKGTINKERSPFSQTKSGGLATKKGAERTQTKGTAEPLPKSKCTLFNAPTVL